MEIRVGLYLVLDVDTNIGFVLDDDDVQVGGCDDER
jgi:hypothetical protein